MSHISFRGLLGRLSHFVRAYRPGSVLALDKMASGGLSVEDVGKESESRDSTTQSTDFKKKGKSNGKVRSRS